MWTGAARGHLVALDVVPVANDQGGMAVGAEGGAACAVVNIAGVDVVQPGIEGDPAGQAQGRRGCGGYAGHFPVGMEGGEVQRYVRAQFARHPVGEFADFGWTVVVAGNEQGGDFQPASGFVVDVGEGVEHGLQMADAELVVEAVGECLEVDIGGIHDGKKIAGGLRVDVAGGDCHVANALFAAGERGVDGVFGKDHRVVVGVGDGIGTVALGGAGDGLRAGFVHQAVHVFRLGNIPVLTELATQVAAGGAEGKY